MNTFKLAFAVTLLAFAGVVAAKSPEKNNPHYQYDPSKSLALNIALATGLTSIEKGPLVDAPAERGPSTVGETTDPIGANRDRQLSGALMTGAIMSKSMAAVPGVSFNTLGALSLVTTILGPSQLPHPATKSQIIAWMPESMADGKSDASKKMKEILLEALHKALQDLGWTMYEGDVDTPVGFGRFEIQKRMIWKNGAGACGSTHYCETSSSGYSPLKAKTAPSMLHIEGPTYVWRNWEFGDDEYHQNTIWYNVLGYAFDRKVRFDGRPLWTPQLGIDRHQLELAMSKYLPAWVFFYAPPEEGRDYPLIMNQGQEYYFIAPAPEKTSSN